MMSAPQFAELTRVLADAVQEAVQDALDGPPGEGHGFKPKAKRTASAGSSAQEAAAASPMMAL